MRFLRSTLALLVVFCTWQPAIAKDNSTNPDSTVEILQHLHGKRNKGYTQKFMAIAEQANITLDPLWHGQELSDTPYSIEDKQKIYATLRQLVQQQFKKVKPASNKSYTASGGAPGCGKTYALEKMYKIDVTAGKFPANAIYIGPDSVVLTQMQAYLDDWHNPQTGPEYAYKKWRAASNYIANFMLVKAMVDGVNIIHDSTSTNIRTQTILDTLKNEGYERHLHFFFADKAAREKALAHRKSKLGYMVALDASPEVSKAEAAFERISDNTYIGRVDSMTLYLQTGKFYLGEGETISFAKYDTKKDSNVKILANKVTFAEHILEVVDSDENLSSALNAAVHKTIETWISST